MKRKKERAAPAQREKRIANWSTILAEIHRIRQCKRTVAGKDLPPPNQSTATERMLAPSPICSHPFYMLPTQARSMAPFQMIESRNNRRSWLASRRSPSNTTKLLASKAPATSLPKAFLAGSRDREYIGSHRSPSKFQFSLFNRKIDNRLDSVFVRARLPAQSADRFAQDNRHHAKRCNWISPPPSEKCVQTQTA